MHKKTGAKLLLGVSMLFLSACGGSGGQTTSTTSTTQTAITPLPANQTTPPAGGLSNATAASYVVLAWNDLGMHCLNPSYDTAVILPPYNTVFAQVIKRGNKPQIITAGVEVSYRMINNTTSQKGLFAQFWANAFKLFGATPAIDMGLNLDNPLISNGLSGTMVAKADHFQVNGIPLTPIMDNKGWNPFQLVEITVKDSVSKAVLAKTRATVPTSDEINCGKCHGNSSDPTVVFNDILTKHDQMHGTTLQAQKPVLCAGCHGSPALGGVGPGSSGKYLSQAIHGAHATRGAACYDCHPGTNTKCSRSIAHTAANGNCTNCHGDMANVAATIAGGSRIPWADEPKCVTCHNSGVAEVDTGAVLYRNSTGHGGVYCSACHGSPHAMTPSTQASDNYQSLQYQGKALTLGDCRVCHNTSRGGGNDFAGEHTGSNHSACNICHTGFQNAANKALWPHQFQWKTR